MYQDFLEAGTAWKPPVLRRSARTSAANVQSNTPEVRTLSRLRRPATKRPSAPAWRASRDQAAELVQLPLAPTPSDPDDLLDYPFPLSGGRIAYLRLPRLTARDAARLAAFIGTFAVDEEPPDPEKAIRTRRLVRLTMLAPTSLGVAMFLALAIVVVVLTYRLARRAQDLGGAFESRLGKGRFSWVVRANMRPASARQSSDDRGQDLGKPPG